MLPLIKEWRELVLAYARDLKSRRQVQLCLNRADRMRCLMQAPQTQEHEAFLAGFAHMVRNQILCLDINKISACAQIWDGKALVIRATADARLHTAKKKWLVAVGRHYGVWARVHMFSFPCRCQIKGNGETHEYKEQT